MVNWDYYRDLKGLSQRSIPPFATKNQRDNKDSAA